MSRLIDRGLAVTGNVSSETIGGMTLAIAVVAGIAAIVMLVGIDGRGW